MGVVGRAFFPYLPIICYFVIFLFGAKRYKIKH
jgi:hypothetical protein